MAHFPRLLLTSLLAIAGCSQSASSEMVTAPAPGQALAMAPAAVRSPYEVTVVGENGGTVDTFVHKGRYYVLGASGQRYTIRVTNPTDQRVEAVVSVDGLDVIDGGDGALGKRGYIVPPRGDLKIEGFRTSTDNVATFRFSSVDSSYAGKLGKARNVGVIAVAVFAEKAAAQIVGEVTMPAPGPRPYRWDADQSASTTGLDDAPSATKSDREASVSDGYAARSEAKAAPRMRQAPPIGGGSMMQPPPPTDVVADKPKTGRSGLGTEFGEQRYSSTTYTAFVRASEQPIAVAELRYNDAPGLQALGIAIVPTPDAGEINLRETADPFPVSHFATPPQ